MRLYKGDCLEVMKEIESGSIDAIITDPPYGTTACKWDSVIDFELMWEQLNRIIKPNGAIVLFGSEPFSSALRLSNIKNYKYDWVWQKNRHSNFFNAKTQPKKVVENILIFYKKKPTYNPELIEYAKGTQRASKWKKGTNKRPEGGQYKDVKMIEDMQTRKGAYPINVIKFKLEQNNQYSKPVVHPTQKPIALMEYLIKTYTNKNETVLDFTMGSGSTGVGCVNTNRNFIGIEMDDKYFEIAEQRIKEANYKLF